VDNFTPLPLFPWERIPALIELEAGLFQQEKNLFPAPISKPLSPSPQISHYTDYAISAF
jgi:hypothetical protein